MMRGFAFFTFGGLASCALTALHQRRYCGLIDSFTSYSLTETDNTSIPVPTTLPPATCTGCAIQANDVQVFSFDDAESSKWASVLVTETILAKTISYFTSSELETVVVEEETLQQATTTFLDALSNVITHTTPSFTVNPTPGVYLEVPAGTYLFYPSIFGGLDEEAGAYPTQQLSTLVLRPFSKRDEPTCHAHTPYLSEIMPTRTQDWRHFFQSVTGILPDMKGYTPEPLPPALIDYLNQVPIVKNIFHGSNLSTCTVATRTSTIGQIHTESQIITWTDEPHPPEMSLSSSAGYGSRPQITQSSSAGYVSRPHISQAPSPGGSTYIRTTYHSTSTYISVQTCMRCDTTTRQSRPSDAKIPKPGGDYLAPPINAQDLKNQHPAILDVGPPVLTIGKITVTAGPNGEYIIGSQTISPGGVEITIEKDTLSLASEGNMVVINGVTSTLSPSGDSVEPTVTIAGNVYKATVHDGTAEYVLGDGITLRPGGMVTISGNIYTLDERGTAIVVNGYTSTISGAPAANSATPTETGFSPQDTLGPKERMPSTSRGSGVSSRAGLDHWIEGMVVGLAGWFWAFL